jgi:demethylmenaquinone methyltransferase / 2-methoxy-6-polyprenyl-1,4-benzoquinol methylase
VQTRSEEPLNPRQIFDAVAADYDGPAQAFGLFQYRRWHQELVAIVQQHPATLVLDMCTGTGAIAKALGATGARVVAADISRAMLESAEARGLAAAADLVQADAASPPFTPQVFDSVVFSYLLRYVTDVPNTITGLANLVRPGGLMASLEFAVPDGHWRPLWLIYTRAILPAGLALRSPGWRRIGNFLGRSISDFDELWPLPRLEEVWRASGFGDVHTRRLSLGGGALTWGTKTR